MALCCAINSIRAKSLSSDGLWETLIRMELGMAGEVDISVFVKLEVFYIEYIIVPPLLLVYPPAI
jgi:hypothetical protein